MPLIGQQVDHHHGDVLGSLAATQHFSNMAGAVSQQGQRLQLAPYYHTHLRSAAAIHEVELDGLLSPDLLEGLS